MASTLGITRLVDGVLTSADSASITITDSTGSTSIPLTAVAASSAGTYSFDVSSLPPGDYTAVWVFVTAGHADDEVVRPFTIDVPVAQISGITLAQIERGVARRVGPYFSLRAFSGAEESVIVRKLRSSLAIGDYEDMFLLRRGVYSSDLLIPNFDDDDRLRMVASYENTTGTLVPDFAWTTGPVENEALELHSLDPDEELRTSVIEGLSRCYFWDALEISTTANLREIDLTAVAPWITRPEQVKQVEYGRLTTAFIPERADWFNAFRRGRSIILQADIPFLGSTRIHALRPHTSFVNGETTLVGPNTDNDVLYIDPEYARLAGHLHCWINLPHKLVRLAQEGQLIGHADVAKQFTIRSAAMCPPFPDIIQNRFGHSSDIWEDQQIGNI